MFNAVPLLAIFNALTLVTLARVYSIGEVPKN